MNSIQLLNAATATTAAPSAASDGVSTAALYPFGGSALLVLKSTAGSDTMTITTRLWGYSSVAAAWFPLGVGADGTKGTLNAGSATGETGANEIRHSERVVGIAGFERLALQVTAIGGTNTAVSAWAVREELGA